MSITAHNQQARMHVCCTHQTRLCSVSKAALLHRRALRRADAFKQAHAADDDGSADAGGAETYAFLPQVRRSQTCGTAAAKLHLSIGVC